MIKLTSILRVSGIFDDFESNLNARSFLYNKYYKRFTKYFLVDYSEEECESKKFCDFAKKNNWEYFKCPANSNNSQAINFGIINSETEYLIVEDIDLIHTVDFYERIKNELLDNWDLRPFNFYSFPVAYLSESESKEIETKPSLLNREYLLKIKDDIELNNPYKYLQHFAPQSSLIVLKRRTAQFVGLFDESFNGWGGEDRDFIFRLISSNTKIIHNKDFGYTSTENGDRVSKYVGWKSIWALHGDYLYNKDFISFHLYHEERKWKKSGARGNNRGTIKYAAQKARIIGSDYFKHITPKPDKNCRFFIFGRNPHICNQDLFDSLGGFHIIEETWDLEKIKSFLHQDSKIIFWNPWGSSRRLFIYNSLKSLGYKTWVAERGALPNSIVFDQDGLVIFSKSYGRDKWLKKLSDTDIQETESYLNSIKESNITLENQGGNDNVDLVKLKLETNKFEKIFLVCLQLKSDTVTNQLVDGYCTYSKFIDEIKKIEENLPINWMLLVKNHPLSKIKYSCSKAKCVDDVHIHTLLNIVDAVVVYNSGTGIISRLFEKPVITFGPNSYSDEYFTVPVNNADECMDAIRYKLPIINHSLVVQYFTFLIKELYSFANFYDNKTRETDVAKLVYPTKVGYYLINNPFSEDSRRYCKDRLDPEKTILFKRFFNSIDNKTIKAVAPQKKIKETSSKATNQQSETNWNQKKGKLMRKLINDPYNYFNDSKYPIRWIRFFFSEKK